MEEKLTHIRKVIALLITMNHEGTKITDGTLEDVNKANQYLTDISNRLEKLGYANSALSAQNGWTLIKPDYPCVFMTRVRSERLKIWEYDIWRIEKLKGEEDGSYYLGWLTEDGDEWDDIANMNFDKYFIIEKS